MKIYCKHHFDAAHKLKLDYESQCRNLHGHRWEVEVWLEGDINKNGIVLDFKEIKKIINELDHSVVNDIVKQPTAENICEFILNRLVNKRPNIKKGRVRIWETPNSYAEDGYRWR